MAWSEQARRAAALARKRKKGIYERNPGSGGEYAHVSRKSLLKTLSYHKKMMRSGHPYATKEGLTKLRKRLYRGQLSAPKGARISPKPKWST